jgi:cytochrome c-type biogenesis protein CcmF
MADIGYWAIVLALVVSLYVAVFALLGERRRSVALVESARNGIFGAAVLSTVSVVMLVALLLGRDYRITYVYDHVSSYLPNAYAVSALWAGQEGSLLLWFWFVAVLGVVLVWRRVWEQSYGRYAVAVVALTQAYLALILLLASNPFAVQATVPAEGYGLNPLLQNFWMVVHPPIVFLSYAAYTIPFALTIGGLVTGNMGDEWLRTVRRWSLFAWLFLGMGIMMGAWWAYLELGWGGYWGWDPVENSSLIPWLMGTALLHSLMMQQRRKAFKTWNLWLIALTFALCMFATFVTRSGIIQSVHAFGRSAVGYYFLAFIVLCIAGFALLLSLRRRALRDQKEASDLYSRETSLLLTNLLFVGAALVVLVGTLFPALVELIQGRQAALNASFYERTVGPVAQVIVVLIGICPWLAWGGVSPDRLRRDMLPPALAAAATVVVLVLFGAREVLALLSFAICAFVVVSLLSIFYRDGTRVLRGKTEGRWQALARLFSRSHRRYGAHIVHLGVVLIAMGITGSSVYQSEVQVTLAPGETVDVEGYTLEYEHLDTEETAAQQRFAATVHVQRGGRKVATLVPEKGFHWNVEQWVTEVAIHTTPKEDLYLILAGFEEDGLAAFRVLLNPLVVWLWIGGGLLLCGGLLAWWPSARESRQQ